MNYGEAPGQNPKKLTPDQLATLRVSAETFATLEAVTLPNLSESDDDDEWSYGIFNKYIQKDGTEIGVIGIADFNSEDSCSEPLSHLVDNLPAEYGDLPVASYGGTATIRDLKTPELMNKYTFWNVYPGALEPLTVIVSDRIEHREDFVEFEGNLKSTIVERIDKLVQEADVAEREALIELHYEAENQVVLWTDSFVSSGEGKILGASDAKKLGALLLEAEHIGTDVPQLL